MSEIPTTLDAIQAEADAAVEGPWVDVLDHLGYAAGVESPNGRSVLWGDDECGGQASVPNAAFIAHARTVVPRLVAALRYAVDESLEPDQYDDVCRDVLYGVARILAEEES